MFGLSHLINGLRPTHFRPLSIQRRHTYWPPPPEKRSPIIELPSGKKCFVFMGKRDCDGKLEPVLCFIDVNGNKLTWLNTEEVHQFDKLVSQFAIMQQSDRLESYFNLFESKSSSTPS